jgi:hypothetical protein
MLISYKENKKGIKQNEPDLSPIIARPGLPMLRIVILK